MQPAHRLANVWQKSKWDPTTRAVSGKHNIKLCTLTCWPSDVTSVQNTVGSSRGRSTAVLVGVTPQTSTTFYTLHFSNTTLLYDSIFISLLLFSFFYFLFVLMISHLPVVCLFSIVNGLHLCSAFHHLNGVQSALQQLLVHTLVHSFTLHGAAPAMWGTSTTIRCNLGFSVSLNFRHKSINRFDLNTEAQYSLQHTGKRHATFFVKVYLGNGFGWSIEFLRASQNVFWEDSVDIIKWGFFGLWQLETGIAEAEQKYSCHPWREE